jgi:hypothetical protein
MKDEYTVIIPTHVEQRYSTELNTTFYDDIIKCNPTINGEQSYREADIQFIKFLFEYGILVSQPQGYICKSFCKKGERLANSVPFYKIINFLAYSYITKAYKDLDLEDEVYDHGSIVKPIDVFTVGKKKGTLSTKIYQDQRMADHAEKWDLNFVSIETKMKYYTSRAKLYCQYVFLRRIAILFRDTQIKEPLYQFYYYLTRCKENNTEVIDLRVDAVQFQHQNWTTGLHEWLMCALFESAFYRTAGLTDDAQLPTATFNKSSCMRPVNGRVKNTKIEGGLLITEQPFYFHEFNWLDYQFLIRSRYEHVINPLNLEGHIRAINAEPFPLTANGWLACFPLTTGGSGLDRPLTALFKQASTPYELIWNTYRFYHSNVLHDETLQYGQNVQRSGYTATGQRTVEYDPISGQNCVNRVGIENFKNELKKTHDKFKMWVRDLWVQHHLTQLPDKGVLIANYIQGEILPTELQVELRRAAETTPVVNQRTTMPHTFK